MASGGARARSGPVGDVNALRQKNGWVELPPRRVGDTPVWPLVDATPREIELWTRLWSRPQAVIWERDQLFEYVALYVRYFAGAELPYSPVNQGTLVKQMSGELMLSPDGMAKQRYRVRAEDDAPAVKQQRPEPGRKSARDRLSVVDGGKAG